MGFVIVITPLSANNVAGKKPMNETSAVQNEVFGRPVFIVSWRCSAGGQG